MCRNGQENFEIFLKIFYLLTNNKLQIMFFFLIFKNTRIWGKFLHKNN